MHVFLFALATINMRCSLIQTWLHKVYRNIQKPHKKKCEKKNY